MDYCQYHPVVAATFYCAKCEQGMCDYCVDRSVAKHSMSGVKARCYCCEQELTSLGSVNKVTPFWRRFDAAFKYGLTTNAIIMIVGLSVAMLVAAYLPMAWLFMLILSGISLKYSFNCLVATSLGESKAPDVADAFSGGVILTIKLYAMMILQIAMVLLMANFISPVLAIVFGLALLLVMPATLIVFGISQSLLLAANPVTAFRIVMAIGLPYLKVLGILMIMVTSVAALVGVIESHLAVVAPLLGGIVSTYYTIVIFHILGYMIFQYQNELGFVAKADDEDEFFQTEEQQRLAQIHVMLKEGRFDKVTELFIAAIKQFPLDKALNNQYLDYLLATKNIVRLEGYCQTHFNYLERTQQSHALSIHYKLVLALLPDYRPDNAAMRFKLARACYQHGDSRTTVKLLKGIHKDFADFNDMRDAMLLMADALDDLPNMAQHAEKARELAYKHKVLSSKQRESALHANAGAGVQRNVAANSISAHASGAEKPAFELTLMAQEPEEEPEKGAIEFS